ncbi:MAG: WYL domain-containing protein [Planctomycetia bacterium]|nr:WYL domain-containing protein [Planctomycetia bacterium]
MKKGTPPVTVCMRKARLIMAADDGVFGRLWGLIMLLSNTPEGMTLSMMKQLQGSSLRTIQRHLATFRRHNVPLTEEIGENGEKKWRIQFRCTELKFSWDEIVAVCMGRRFFDPMKGSHLWAAMESAMNKMERCLGIPIADLERLAGAIQPVPSGLGDYHRRRDMINELNQAIDDRQRVLISYRSVQDVENGIEASPVCVDPYGMAWYEGGLYLIGWSHKRNAIRHWKLDRMNSIVPLRETFVPPENFDFTGYVGQLFGICGVDAEAQPIRVRIRLRGEAARLVREKRWHYTEKFETTPDGATIFRVELDNPKFLKRWVLGFGRHAEVLEPEELRMEVKRELEQMMEMYRDPGSGDA